MVSRMSRCVSGCLSASPVGRFSALIFELIPPIWCIFLCPICSFLQCLVGTLLWAEGCFVPLFSANRPYMMPIFVPILCVCVCWWLGMSSRRVLFPFKNFRLIPLVWCFFFCPHFGGPWTVGKAVRKRDVFTLPNFGYSIKPKHEVWRRGRYLSIGTKH